MFIIFIGCTATLKYYCYEGEDLAGGRIVIIVII